MYRRIFINNNSVNVSPNRGDVTFYFNKPIVTKDDEVIEMRLSEAWFLLTNAGNFIQRIDYGVQSNILGKISGYTANAYNYVFIKILLILEQEFLIKF